MEELKNIRERLDKLDTDKLIDVIKNYHQYGYSEEIRNYSLTLLQQRGVSQEDLRLTGNLRNNEYETAERLFRSFKANSQVTFISYLFSLIALFHKSFFKIDSAVLQIIILVLSIIAWITFFVCLIKSFLNQSDFYKLTGDDFTSGALIYFLIGMPFYVIMYFIFLGQMKEKMKAIT